ncbi:unnamed protein product, partial [Prorocentrum cordatum]
MGRLPVPTDAFTTALSILTCIVLKDDSMKKEYKLTDQQCAEFNPKDVRQERLKMFGLYQKDSSAGGAEEVAGPSRVRFPAEEWGRLAEPLAANYANPTELIAYVRGLAESDPWDASRGRYAEKV